MPVRAAVKVGDLEVGTDEGSKCHLFGLTTDHPHVHRRRAAERPPEPLPTRFVEPDMVARFADRDLRGEVAQEFREAGRQRK